MDTELMKFVEALPLSYRVALGKIKIVHKMMTQSDLSASIVHRRKKGFTVPFGAWSPGSWRAFIENVLLDTTVPHFTMLQHAGVRRIWEQHLAGRPGA